MHLFKETSNHPLSWLSLGGGAGRLVWSRRILMFTMGKGETSPRNEWNHIADERCILGARLKMAALVVEGPE